MARRRSRRAATTIVAAAERAAAERAAGSSGWLETAMTRAWFAGYSPLTTESPLLPQVEADSWQSLAWLATVAE